MIEGLRRVDQQGFTVTDNQESFVRRMEGMGSPIRAFVAEHCILGADQLVPSNALFCRWQVWREDNMSEHESRGEREKFGRNLQLAFPEVKRIQKRCNEGRYCYTGIGLRPFDTADVC